MIPNNILLAFLKGIRKRIAEFPEHGEIGIMTPLEGLIEQMEKPGFDLMISRCLWPWQWALASYSRSLRMLGTWKHVLSTDTIWQRNSIISVRWERTMAERRQKYEPVFAIAYVVPTPEEITKQFEELQRETMGDKPWMPTPTFEDEVWGQ